MELSFIEALSCVFRAGRKGASTDHSSILFDVDIASGTIKEGSTNAHWYALGPRAPLTTPWRSVYSTDVHPDAPDRRVTGLKIHPDMAVRACPCLAVDIVVVMERPRAPRRPGPGLTAHTSPNQIRP